MISITRLFVIFCLASLAVLFTFFSEKSPLIEGYGSDGLFYGHYTSDLTNSWENKDIPKRLFERILAVTTVHAGLKAVNSSTEADTTFILENKKYFISKNVIQGFKIYNLFIFCFSLFLWHKILSNSGVSDLVYAFAFILLFVNFANLKQWFYEPVMLDPTTFCFGLLILYSWLYKSNFTLFIISILSLVINIASVFFCLILFSFKKDKLNLISDLYSHKKSLLLSILGTIIIVGSCLWNFYFPLCSFTGENETIHYLFPLSLVIIMLTMFYGYYFLLKDVSFFDYRKLIDSFNSVYFFIFIFIFFLTHLFFTKYAGPRIDTICDDKPFTIINYFLATLRLGYSRPGGFFAAHFAYFGLAFCFVIVNYRHIAQNFRERGYGSIFFSIMAVTMFLNTESRQMIFLLPFAVYFAVTNPAYEKLKFVHLYFILFFALITSKVWFTINPFDNSVYPPNKVENFAELYNFPLQKYFMNLGPWMGDKMYVVHICFFAVLMVSLYLFQLRVLSSSHNITDY